MSNTIIVPAQGQSIASFLKSATTSVNVASATAPTTGQVLTATDSTHATWQTPSGGAPSGSAGGDLSGTYPNPTLKKPLADVLPCSSDVTLATAANSTMASGLKPVFYPVRVNVLSMAVQALAIEIQTGNASAVLGAGIYSIVYSSALTFAATKVATLSGTFDGSASGRKIVDLTSAPVTLDFSANQYVVGLCSNQSTIVKIQGTSGAPQSKTPGSFLYNTALSDATAASWPGSFTQSSVVALGTGDPIGVIYMYSAAGKNWF